jgi:hypothetical protein
MNGPANFLWFCDLANFVVAVALWRESSLLFSSQAVGVLLIQLVWIVDFGAALLLGVHPVGGTEYMFDAAEPLWVRLLSLFHVFVPVLLCWALARLGHDPRGWKLQTAIAWIVLPVTFFFTDPALNLNWLRQPFGVEQTLMPPLAYLVFCMVAYPLVLYLPTHAARWFWQRRRRPAAGAPVRGRLALR